MIQPPKTATLPHSPLPIVELNRGTEAFTCCNNSPSLALVICGRQRLGTRGEWFDEEEVAEAPSSVLLRLIPAARHISQGNSSLQVRFSTCLMNWLVLVGVWGLWGGAGGSLLLGLGDTLCPRLPPASSQVRVPPLAGNLHPPWIKAPLPAPPQPWFSPATPPPALAGASPWRPQDWARFAPDPPKVDFCPWMRPRAAVEALRPPSTSSSLASLGDHPLTDPPCLQAATLQKM